MLGFINPDRGWLVRRLVGILGMLAALCLLSLPGVAQTTTSPAGSIQVIDIDAPIGPAFDHLKAQWQAR